MIIRTLTLDKHCIQKRGVVFVEDYVNMEDEVGRKSYTLYEKRKAVEKVKEVGVREASRQLKIPRKNLQRWSKQTELLENAALTRGSNIRSKRRLTQSRAKYPLLESALIDFIKEERGKRNSVTGKQIRRKAMVLYQTLYPGSRERFSASYGWLRRMVRRNNLSFRRVTSVGQKVPDDAPERCDTFLAEMKSLGDFDIIMNMDETPCYFDMPSSVTFDLKGVQTVKVRTTGNEKLRFTVVLTAGVRKVDDHYEAITLPPMVIFKNLAKAPKGKFPKGMVIEGTKGGTMKRGIMKDCYGPQLWKKRPGSFFQQPKSLLIMDSAKSHLGDVPEFFKSYNTECKIIDGGMTPLLQFIDTHVNKPFKDILKERWADWFTNCTEEFTKQGNRRRASYEMICQWIIEAWKVVAKPEFVVSGFQQCGYIEWDGDYQKLHSRLRDTILNRAVPIETILEVNEMLLELEEANMDIVTAFEDEEVDMEDETEEDDNNETDSDDGNDEDIVIE